MTREEFMPRPSDFSFSVNPLDINLANMQMKLLEDMKIAKTVCGVVFDTISEAYNSQNPLREYGMIMIDIYKYRGSLSGSQYRARITVTNKDGDLWYVAPLFVGDWDWMQRFIDGKEHTWGGKWDFFSLCKANAMWFDYCMKNNERQYLRELSRELIEEMQNEVDSLYFYNNERKVFCHGHPDLMHNPGFPIGEGMAMFKNDSNPSLYIVNTTTNEIRQLVDHTGHVVGFEKDDFDWEKLKEIEHRRCLDDMVISYAGIGRYSDYSNGVCCISWMLYPDGRYFADSDGYGMEDNDEENIYCILDKHLHVLIPWQPMTYAERQKLMKEAIDKLTENNTAG